MQWEKTGFICVISTRDQQWHDDVASYVTSSNIALLSWQDRFCTEWVSFLWSSFIYQSASVYIISVIYNYITICVYWVLSTNIFPVKVPYQVFPKILGFKFIFMLCRLITSKRPHSLFWLTSWNTLFVIFFPNWIMLSYNSQVAYFACFYVIYYLYFLFCSKK